MSGAGFLTADWPGYPDVVAGTTLRGGGQSTGPYRALNLGAHVGDEPDVVRSNRKRAAAMLDWPMEPGWLRQVHGTAVVEAPFEGVEPVADACVTNSRNVVCAVLTADCLPVLFAAADGRAVGAAHAGWRGLAAGVLEATVAAFACNPGNLRAWLGPAISQDAFEIGGEVRDAFTDRLADTADCFVENSAGRWQADLYALARLILARAGVGEVYGGGRCTYNEPDAFFSYRRDGQCGRMASVIWRRGDQDSCPKLVEK